MGKLVRDRIPELIRKSGRTPRVWTLRESEFTTALYDKLDEEAAELRSARTRDEAIAEAADVLEVLTAIAALHDIGLDSIIARAHAKSAERGGFTRRLWLEGVGPSS